MSDHELQRLLRHAQRTNQIGLLVPEVLRNLGREECLAARVIIEKNLSWLEHRERVWKTRDGRRVKIKDLDNEHLLTVQHYLRTKHGREHHSAWIRRCVDEEVERRQVRPEDYGLDAASKKRAKKARGRHAAVGGKE